MNAPTIVDTGPLVAVIVANDRYHHWARSVLQLIDPPLVTCEAVITECYQLVGNSAGGRNAILAMLTENLIAIDFQLSVERLRVRELMRRYASRPMSLADACLVRMAELLPASKVMTIDGNFHVYKRSGR